MFCLVRLAALIGVVAQISNIHGNDYCGHRWEDNNDFYPLTTDILKPIHLRRTSNKADLLVSQASGQLFILRSKPTGLFDEKNPIIISQGDFCNGGTIHVADMDGDHYDDLLCRKSDGTFTVRYFYRQRFTPPEPYAEDFQCGITSVEILIGDFDGNHASDILCYSTTATNLDSSPIYFSQIKCHDHHYHFHQHGRFARHIERFRPNSFGYDGYVNRATCPQGLPYISALPSGSLSLCQSAIKYMVLDANGDGRDDVACHLSNDFYTYLSRGIATTDTFSRTALVVDNCDSGGYTVIPNDIDGDGDDDLVCAKIYSITGTDRLKHILFSAGSYPDFGPTISISPGPPWGPFCSDSAGGGIPRYITGDFNGDGKSDLMCRYLSSATHMETRIVFSSNCP